jgi:hypothetical protein
MADATLAAALVSLEGEWFWHFLEDVPPPAQQHRLSIKGGEVREAGLPCRVALVGNEIRVRLSDETCKLRFAAEPEQTDDTDAQFWVLPDGLDDAAHRAMPIEANDNGMEMLELVALVRAD